MKYLKLTEFQNWGWKWSLPWTICLRRLSSPSSPSACWHKDQFSTSLPLQSHLAKGRIAAQQDESNNTTAPQVLSSWGESLGDDLRGKIGGGPTNWRHCWELVLVLGETKVSHQQRLQKESLLRNATFEEDYFYRSSAIVVIEKVFRFEVSMHNSTGVKISHSRKNLLRPNTVFPVL